MKGTLLFMTCAMLAAGCGEREQIKSAEDASARDAPAWKGAANTYVAPGWQAGDQRAWESQLRRRAQYQNEFAKAN